MKDTTYLTIQQAAAALGLSPATVRQMAKEKKIPALRIGRGEREHFRIHRDALQGVSQ